MMWMQFGSHVVEIKRRGDSVRNCYFSMINALDMRYGYFLADDITKSNITHEAKIALGIDSFDKLLVGYR